MYYIILYIVFPLKETKENTFFISSRLYEQLRMRPRSHFSQNFELYTLQTLKRRPRRENNEILRKIETPKVRRHMALFSKLSTLPQKKAAAAAAAAQQKHRAIQGLRSWNFAHVF